MTVELEVIPIHDSSAPGWHIETPDTYFILWAPKDSRPGWAASWEMWEPHPTNPEEVVDTAGGFERGESLEAVLAVFDRVPTPDLGARVRRLLSGAAREHNAGESLEALS